MKNKKWLDNFGKADNANESSVNMSEDFVGLGYNTEGRNYSPAWGGQFQIGGKLNPISPTQQIQQAVEPTPTVPYLQTKDPAEFYKSWIQSPEYARRQLLTGYSEGEDLYMPNAAASRESRLGAIEEMTPITYSARQPSEAKPGVYGSPSYVNINPSDYVGTSKEAIQAHELAHIAGAMGEVRPGMMSGTEQDIFKKSMLPMKEPVLSGVQGSKEREASVRALEDFKHSQEPDEAKADLDALRFMMYDKGIYDITKGKKFTETDFQKAKQNLGNDRVFKRLENRMGKENFVKLMNTIALADDQEEAPIAMGGMSIPGSVGFSYARVAGAAPSKGKYAKKTMASAQNGIMSPMLLARNVLNYFYPSEEAAPAVEAAPVEYKKGLTNELLQRQAYKESTFNPAAVSPAGYKGLTQIGDSILKDYSNKKGGKKLDPFNPEDAVELQKFAMDNLYNSDFINKPNQPDSVRIAKTLAAYNWGRGNLSNYLHEQKNKGVDIYDSYDWLNNLPKETSDYVNKILLQEDPSFNKNYKKASTNPKYEEVTSLYDQKKFGGDIPSAQNGQEMRFYQNGLDWKPRSMKDGGITKDNQGYWNPDNWGKPVQIDSNDITMEGVYEPLLGVSDTGDTKLMQPGKNYKFKGKKVIEFPVAQPGKTVPAQQEVSRQDYLSKFNMYDDVLKSKNYTTPYYKDNNIDTSEGGMNCINGVCYMVSNIAGVKFDKAQTKDTYTGNATFGDNAMDEGYYRSNPEKEGFGVGDIFQYSRKKGSMGSRFPGEVNFKNENDLYPNHAVLIVNEFVKDGEKYFKIANNAGGDKVEIEDVPESELMNRYKKGYKTFDGGITYRYDPDRVTSIKKENEDRANLLKGKNPYANQYSKFDTSNLAFFNNKVDGLNIKDELVADKNLQKYADVYKTVYSDLGKGSNMPIDSFNKLITNQVGIAGQETKFGELASNPKDFVPDTALPFARRAKEIYNSSFGTEDNWKKDYWDNNADNVQKEFSSYEDFAKSLASEDSDYNPYRTPRSIGEFQQKDLSERGNFYKYDLDSFEGQVKSSLALAVDNYHKLKAKYPDLSEDQIIDLTTLMHNAPGKALEPRFVNYYLKNNDVDYVDKVKDFAPKSFGKNQPKDKKVEWEEISPEKAKSITDYVKSLQTKRNGGDVGINQLDAQPMKKLNQLLNFTNNPDKDNWLDKYN